MNKRIMMPIVDIPEFFCLVVLECHGILLNVNPILHNFITHLVDKNQKEELPLQLLPISAYTQLWIASKWLHLAAMSELILKLYLAG